MTRTRLLVALLAVIVTAGVLVLKVKTKIDWDKLQSIEVYTDSTLGKDFEKMEDVDLTRKAHHGLDLEKAKLLLEKSKTEVQVVTVWKGHQYAVATFSEGKPLRLKVSNYGGFFFVLNFGRKYQIRKSDIDAWDKLWAGQ
jgi:hypothetical protein